MNVAGVSSRGRPTAPLVRRTRGSWVALAVAGAAAFWLANLVISVTPVAADYRRAVSIGYEPMLVEAAVGGLVLASVLALLLVRHPSKVPGSSLLGKSLLLGATALVVLTIGIEVPSKLASRLDDPAHWLLVATVFNLVRLLALAVTIGLVAEPHGNRRGRRAGRAGKGVEK